jgi:hypothetical protein
VFLIPTDCHIDKSSAENYLLEALKKALQDPQNSDSYAQEYKKFLSYRISGYWHDATNGAIKSLLDINSRYIIPFVLTIGRQHLSQVEAIHGPDLDDFMAVLQVFSTGESIVSPWVR